jgi:hypothetical protein
MVMVLLLFHSPANILALFFAAVFMFANSVLGQEWSN